MRGLIVKSTGNDYRIRLENGEFLSGKTKGTLRLDNSKSTNPITIGDWVRVEEVERGYAVISSLEERKNYVARHSSNLSKKTHVLAANVDCVLLTATLNKPVTYPEFIDRILVSAEAYHIPVVIAFNKIDLLNEEERKELEEWIKMYSSIGYPSLALSVKENIGIEELSKILQNKITLVSGNSGVGKSSLINALIPSLSLRVGDLSNAHQKGMHTTTFSEMFSLPQGGEVIDTPGIKGFGVINIEEEELSHYFPEMFKLSSQCKYYNCTHTHEPDCAVLNALEKGEGNIYSSRYRSYLKMIGDLAGEEKYRK